MHYSKGTLLVFLVVTCSLASADEEKTQKVEAADDRNSAATPAQHSSSELLSIPPNLIQAFTHGGVVVAGLFAIAALAMLIVPNLSNTRFCHLFNNCDPTLYQAYTAQGNSLYGDYQYGQGGTYNNPTYQQKRSIEYITPVLKAIGSAYDKYSQAGVTAKKMA